MTFHFHCCVDEGHKVCDLYGVWGPKKFMGKEYEGILRTTFLIDGNGNILNVFENVRPAEHSAEVLSAFGVKSVNKTDFIQIKKGKS